MELRYRLVNVFTRGREPLSGNPLCVFEDGRGLDTATMQALARQFNLSETTFILPSETAEARVRIFTPSYEMQFAGHPTLGTAHVCRALGLGGDSLTLEMQAGLIPVSAARDRWTLQAQPATWRDCRESRETLAAMLGVEPGDIGAKPLWVKAGKEQLVIPLTSEAAVRKAAPRADAVARIVNEDGQGMAYVFTMTGYRASARALLFSGRQCSSRGSGDRLGDGEFRRLAARNRARAARRDRDQPGRSHQAAIDALSARRRRKTHLCLGRSRRPRHGQRATLTQA